jgi:spore coat-associated protein N
MPGRSAPKKLLLSLGALGAAGAIAGLGTFATFTSTTSASQNVTAGKVEIALGTPGAGNALSVSATNVVPGDTIRRAVDLSNTSSDGLKTVSLATTATTSSVLDTDTSLGLKMYVQSCSLGAGWTVTGTSPALVYTCPSGTISNVLGTAGSPVTVVQTGNLTPLNALSAGTSTDHLLVVVTLPTGNTTANLATPPSSTILYTFTGTQRDGTDR